jgi:DNA-binding response OmpR family regulator
MKILLVEDDPKISAFIRQGLREEGMTVDIATDGEEGNYLCTIGGYDVVILDWMLPEINGIEICRGMRSRRDMTPVLMLTARGDVEDRVEGLESGADDYLAKPFSFRELIARIHALHRRRTQNGYGVLTAADLILDPIKRIVKRGEKTIDLTVREFELLEYLLRNKNRIVTVTMIMEQLWDMQEVTRSNVVNVTIHHLRGKIDRDFDVQLIKTVRGSGYRLEE